MTSSDTHNLEIVHVKQCTECSMQIRGTDNGSKVFDCGHLLCVGCVVEHKYREKHRFLWGSLCRHKICVACRKTFDDWAPLPNGVSRVGPSACPECDGSFVCANERCVAFPCDQLYAAQQRLCRKIPKRVVETLIYCWLQCSRYHTDTTPHTIIPIELMVYCVQFLEPLRYDARVVFPNSGRPTQSNPAHRAIFSVDYRFCIDGWVTMYPTSSLAPQHLRDAHYRKVREQIAYQVEAGLETPHGHIKKILHFNCAIALYRLVMYMIQHASHEDPRIILFYEHHDLMLSLKIGVGKDLSFSYSLLINERFLFSCPLLRDVERVRCKGAFKGMNHHWYNEGLLECTITNFSF